MMHSPKIFPVPLLHFEQIDSTNHYLKTICDESSVAELTTVVADYQSSGRGQRGNSWESEAGKNLIFSFVLYPTFLEARRQFLLSQLISLALKEELDRYAEGFSIKWPNDIYWHEQKIAGILIENDLTGCCLGRSIAGIGLNVNQIVFQSTAPNPVSLYQITRQEHNCFALLSSIMKRVRTEYLSIQNGEATNIADRYRASLFRGKGMHRYEDLHGEFMAEISHIESEGILVLQDNKGQKRRYAFKEVKYHLP